MFRAEFSGRLLMKVGAAALARAIHFLGNSRWGAAAAAVVVFLWVVHFGTQQMTPHWQERNFYQYEMGPAIMVACGHGLRRESAEPQMASFLGLKQQSLDCAHAVPDGIETELKPFQSAHRYLLLTVGQAWKLFGVDWRVIDRLAIGLYALSCALAFLLLRIFLPPVWSLAGAWLYATAGTHLRFLDYLRDYAKVPFVLAILWGLAWLLHKRRPLAQVLTVALLMGCTLGLGLGFRMDLLIFLPFAAGMLLLFYPAPLREAWRERGLAVAVLVLAAYVCAYPVLTAMAEGSNAAHVILLGLSQEFSSALGLVSLDYQLAPHYNDAYQLMQVEALAALRGQQTHLVLANSRYEFFSTQLLTEYLLHFPADLGLRVGAAIVRGIAYEFELQLDLAGECALVLVALTCIAIGWHSRRLGLAFTVAIAFLFAYQALQFNLRHFFYLSIVPLLGAGLVCYGAIRALRYRAMQSPMGSQWNAVLAVRQALLATGMLLLIPILAWLLLWSVQRSTQHGLLQAARSLPVHWLAEVPSTKSSSKSNVLTTRQFGEWWQERKRRQALEHSGNERLGYFWVFDLDPAIPGCSTSLFRAALSYRASDAYYDFGRTLTYALKEPIRVFVPAMEMKWTRSPAQAFSTVDSLMVDDPSWSCVERVGSAEPNDSFPLLIDLVVPRSDAVRHLRPALPRAFADSIPGHWTVAAAPLQTSIAELYLGTGAVESLRLKDAYVLAGDAVTLEPHGLQVLGAAEGRYSYLVRTDAVHFGPGDVLRVSGVLREGGLSVGLVKDAAWAHQLPVLQPGDFDLFFAPEPGDYHVVIANHVAKPRALNVFDITRFGLVRQAH